MSGLQRTFVLLVVLQLFVAVPVFAQAGATPSRSLKVLTMNTALLRIIKDWDVAIDERALLIPYKVAETGADIVLLQEVWNDKLRDQLVRSFAALGYTNAAFRSTPWLLQRPDGLLTVSKSSFKIKSQWFYGLTNMTNQTRFKEYFIHKGVLVSEVEIPGLGSVDVFNVHLGALTFKVKVGSGGPHAIEQHTKQVDKLVQFLKSFDSQSKARLIGGDFNHHYFAWDFTTSNYDKSRLSNFYSLMTESSGLHWLDAAVAARAGTGVSPLENPDFTWIHDGDISEVLDYMFVNSLAKIKPVRSEVISLHPLTAVEFDKLKMEYPQISLETNPEFYSDHHALMTTFLLP